MSDTENLEDHSSTSAYHLMLGVCIKDQQQRTPDCAQVFGLALSMAVNVAYLTAYLSMSFLSGLESPFHVQTSLYLLVSTVDYISALKPNSPRAQSL